MTNCTFFKHTLVFLYPELTLGLLHLLSPSFCIWLENDTLFCSKRLEIMKTIPHSARLLLAAFQFFLHMHSAGRIFLSAGRRQVSLSDRTRYGITNIDTLLWTLLFKWYIIITLRLIYLFVSSSTMIMSAQVHASWCLNPKRSTSQHLDAGKGPFKP